MAYVVPYDTEPVCCGEPMAIQEYDADDDLYAYSCVITPSHPLKYVEKDDETWK